MNIVVKPLLIIFLIAGFSWCGLDSWDADVADDIDVGCPEIYQPVCWAKKGECKWPNCQNIEKTFQNDCFAKKDKSIVLYPWDCKPKDKDEKEPRMCTMEYDPVCWKSKNWEAKTYSNPCMATNDEAEIVSKGECK